MAAQRDQDHQRDLDRAHRENVEAQRRLRALHHGYREPRYRVEDGPHERGSTPQVVHEDALTDSAVRQQDFEQVSEPHQVAAELRKRVRLSAAQGYEPAAERLSKLPEDELPADHDEPPPATAHEFDVERRRLNEEAEEALRAMRAMMLKTLGGTPSAQE